MELKLDNISVTFHQKPILKNISFTVKNGEFLSLLGPSGGGKTTLLKTIAGLVPSSEGHLYLNSKEVTSLPAYKRQTIIVFQDIRLFPHLSVGENIAYPLKLKKYSPQQRREKIKEYLSAVGLEGFEQRMPLSLSGGEQQRIALVRALAAEPTVLLLDEPFSALDENLRAEARQLVESLHQRFHMTTILVTHDQEEALSLSDRVAVIIQGELLQIDSPQVIYQQPTSRSVANFFGGRSWVAGEIKDQVFNAPEITLPALGYENGLYDWMCLNCDLRQDPEGSFDFRVESVHYQGGENRVVLSHSSGLRLTDFLPPHLSVSPGQILTYSHRQECPLFFERNSSKGA